jgi:hypothetical protein
MAELIIIPIVIGVSSSVGTHILITSGSNIITGCKNKIQTGINNFKNIIKNYKKNNKIYIETQKNFEFNCRITKIICYLNNENLNKGQRISNDDYDFIRINKYAIFNRINIYELMERMFDFFMNPINIYHNSGNTNIYDDLYLFVFLIELYRNDGIDSYKYINNLPKFKFYEDIFYVENNYVEKIPREYLCMNYNHSTPFRIKLEENIQKHKHLFNYFN